MIRLRNLGEWKIRLMRVTQYFNIIAFASSVLTVLKVYGFSGYSCFLLIPIFILIMWYDNKKALVDEYAYLNDKNLQWQETRKQIKEIHEMMGKR